MQFKVLTIVTSLLAATSVQAAALPTTPLSSLTQLTTQTNALTSTVKGLNTNNILTTLSGVLGTVGQLISSIGTGSNTFNNASPTQLNQAELCTAISGFTTAQTGLLNSLNAKLGLISGSLFGLPITTLLSILDGVLGTFGTQLASQVPACSTATTAGFAGLDFARLKKTT
ncbi:hypothetical protein AK830_g12116 [Neonectria ditissima]|uniref:Uncharacterized protein n=1 Tax=Neonectria ditissima TaxID=78410 RepID=A0A0N8H4V8_9HYPO|nr:hypothetical protein AK830_g12116 [Neonectria ditissima]